MADYYSHRDSKQKGDGYLDYDTGSGRGWIWAGVVLVVVVALIALGATSGGDGSAPVSGEAAATGATAPASIDDTTMSETPAATAPATE